MSGISSYNQNADKRIIITDDGKRYKKSSTGKTIGAIAVADVASAVISTTTEKLTQKPFVNIIQNESAKSTELERLLYVKTDKFAEYRKAAGKAYKKSGLPLKGVKFANVNNKNRLIIGKEYKSAYPDRVKIFEKIPFIKKRIDNNVNKKINDIVNGYGACFVPKIKKILVNKNTVMSMSSFHEMGHALNDTTKGIGKVLLKTRGPARTLASVAMLTALFKRKKADGEKPKGIFDKTTTFIKNHCGAIAGISMLPTLMEEGLASIKGAKLAKATKMLSHDKLKTLYKFQGAAFLTYFGEALGITLATIAMSKIKDKMTKPEEIKSN